MQPVKLTLTPAEVAGHWSFLSITPSLSLSFVAACRAINEEAVFCLAPSRFVKQASNLEVSFTFNKASSNCSCRVFLSLFALSKAVFACNNVSSSWFCNTFLSLFDLSKLFFACSETSSNCFCRSSLSLFALSKAAFNSSILVA